MSDYKLEPYSGVGPLKFGMTEEAVFTTIGPAVHRTHNRRGEVKLKYSAMEFTFDKSASLVEISLAPGIKLDVYGIAVFEAEDALAQLLRFENQPLEYVGILFLPSLGMTMLGFHHEDDSKSITADSRGRLDGVLPRFRPVAKA